jgi:hypothetical protein
LWDRVGRFSLGASRDQPVLGLLRKKVELFSNHSQPEMLLAALVPAEVALNHRSNKWEDKLGSRATLPELRATDNDQTTGKWECL